MATIRFEDLGRPIQKLLLGLKGGYTEEDMGLMAYVHVKDMVKIYDDLNSQKAAEQIWKDLKKELVKRKEEKERETQTLHETGEQINAVEQQLADAEEAERLAEEKRQRKKEKKRRKAEQAAALAEQEDADADAAAEAEAEAAAAAAAEEAEKERLREERRAAKQKRKEEKEAALREEEERLAQEEAEEEARVADEKRARKAERKRLNEEAARLRAEEESLRKRREHAKAKKANLREQWEEHVKNHPFEFCEKDDGDVGIVQTSRGFTSKKPPSHFLKVKSVTIPTVEEQEEVAYYSLEVQLHSGKSLHAKRRYNQFCEMRGNLGGTLETLDVQFPGKTLWKVKGPALEKRRTELELWVNNVIDKLSTTRSYAGVQLDAKQQLRGDAARAEAEKQRMKQVAIARAALHKFCGIEDDN